MSREEKKSHKILEVYKSTFSPAKIVDERVSRAGCFSHRVDQLQPFSVVFKYLLLIKHACHSYEIYYKCNKIFKHGTKFQMIRCTTRYRMIKSIILYYSICYSSLNCFCDKFSCENCEDKYAFSTTEAQEQFM